jgi:hypothetical protein
MEYNVGQILYVVLKKDSKVIPMQVYEEITRKTMDGLKIDYVVKVGSDENTTLKISEIEGDIFSSPEEAITILTEKAKSSITKLVSMAQDKAKIWYEMKPAKIERVAIDSEEEVIHFEPKNNDNDRMKVKLSDGTIANIKLPSAIA